jgi:hypothetical protein
MDVKRGRMVSLGYGKYWRSDRILGLMPIEEGRGPGQRTNVFIEGQAEPIVASRTEQSILEDMGAAGDSFRLESLREATRELLEAFHEFSPVLRRARTVRAPTRQASNAKGSCVPPRSRRRP